MKIINVVVNTYSCLYLALIDYLKKWFKNCIEIDFFKCIRL